MSTEPRFTLYVRAGQDGKSIGDCILSQTAYMTSELKVPPSDIHIAPVNTFDPPKFFLNLNPAGKAPLLVDRKADNTISDCSAICRYLSETYPSDVKRTYDGPEHAVKGIDDAAGPKFIAFLKRKQGGEFNEAANLRRELVAELTALDECFQEIDSGQYQISDHLRDVDCQLLPQLRHIQVAGKFYKNFEIPQELTTLMQYIRCREQSEVFKKTCPPDEEILYGWSKEKNKYAAVCRLL